MSSEIDFIKKVYSEISEVEKRNRETPEGSDNAKGDARIAYLKSIMFQFTTCYEQKEHYRKRCIDAGITIVNLMNEITSLKIEVEKLNKQLEWTQAT